MAEEQKFPSEVVDLPSGGKIYGKDSPLYEGKIELKYMTAREEDILTSQNLITKGVVVQRLLDSLILTDGVKSDDLIIGDKNAVMVAARILAYGPEYECEVTHPTTGELVTHTFNLADCPFKDMSTDVKENRFEIKLPVSKAKVIFKLLTGVEEELIAKELKQIKKLGGEVSPELTTRLRHVIISVDDDEKSSTVNNFAQNMLSRDSLFLRAEIVRIAPDINMEQEVEIGGETVKVAIPMTATFFWPSS